jgi:hypothetical protein
MCLAMMGVRREGKRQPLHPPPPPLAGQNSMFFNFFEENNIFLCFFRQIVCFWKILPSPGKKSVDAHAYNKGLIEYFCVGLNFVNLIKSIEVCARNIVSNRGSAARSWC